MRQQHGLRRSPQRPTGFYRVSETDTQSKDVFRNRHTPKMRSETDTHPKDVFRDQHTLQRRVQRPTHTQKTCSETDRSRDRRCFTQTRPQTESEPVPVSHRECISGGVYVPCIYTHAGESYCRRLRPLLYLRYVFRALINTLVC